MYYGPAAGTIEAIQSAVHTATLPATGSEVFSIA